MPISIQDHTFVAPPSDEPLHHIRPFFEGRSSHFREGDSSSHEQLLASDDLVDA